MGITAFLVIVASGIFVLAVYNMQSVKGAVDTVIGALTPVWWGLALAYILAPVANFFEKKCFRKFFYWRETQKAKKANLPNPSFVPHDKKIRIKRKCRGISVAATMLLALILVAGLAWAVAPQLVETIQALINNLPTYVTEVSTWLSDLLEGYPEIQAPILDFLSNMTKTLQDFLTNSLLPQMTDIMGAVSTTVMDVIGVFLNMLMGFVLSIYLLYNKELFAAQAKKSLYCVFKKTTSNRILRNVRHVHKTFGGFITGKLLDCLIIGMLILVIMTLFGMPYAMLISVIMCVANIIPYFGCFIGGVPCVLLMLVVDPVQALILLIIICVVQFLDGNVISPLILGESTGLSGFWVVFALLVGQLFFGFIGLIIGIPLFAVIYSILKERISKKLTEKELPSDTNIYRDVAYLDGETGEIITLHQVRDKERLEKEERERQEDEERRKRRKHIPLVRRFQQKHDSKNADAPKAPAKNSKKK